MDRYDAVSRLAMFLGVLAIGISLGASWGLVELQQSCVAAGKLPQPGASLLGVELDENACWDGARRMQLLANISVITGCVLTLGGGIMDEYDERVREWLS